MATCIGSTQYSCVHYSPNLSHEKITSCAPVTEDADGDDGADDDDGDDTDYPERHIGYGYLSIHTGRPSDPDH